MYRPPDAFVDQSRLTRRLFIARCIVARIRRVDIVVVVGSRVIFSSATGRSSDASLAHAGRSHGVIDSIGYSRFREQGNRDEGNRARATLEY